MAAAAPAERAGCLDKGHHMPGLNHRALDARATPKIGGSSWLSCAARSSLPKVMRRSVAFVCEQPRIERSGHKANANSASVIYALAVTC
jgi:hypothetical protein